MKSNITDLPSDAESLCFVLAVQCALLVLTEFSQQAQKRYEKKLRKQVKKGCKC